MEFDHVEKMKKGSIFKKLEKYLSMVNRSKSSSSSSRNMFTKSKSWSSGIKEKQKKTTPHGCFTVYVGEERERFVIKAEFANHPLFKVLLEDAELEYGFSSEGPLILPCKVDLFCKLMSEMDQFDEDEYRAQRRGFGYGGCSPFSPKRRLGKSDMAKGCSSYGLLTPQYSHKINHF